MTKRTPSVPPQSDIPRAPHGDSRASLRRGAALVFLLLAGAMCQQSTASVQEERATVLPETDTGGGAGLGSGQSVFTGARLYVTPDSPFPRQAADWRSSRPGDAAVMDALAQRAQAIWLGEWNTDLAGDVRDVMRAAAADRSLPVFVAYFIPLRDCGGYSRGGAASAESYREWIGIIERAIGDGRAAVILEPDALAGIDCLTAGQRAERLGLIRGAVETLSKHPNIGVYVDAGHARWKSPAEMASVLQQVNIKVAAGFALNISNFLTTEESISYGAKISAATGGKHFLIDTSRNGAGPTADLAWCNPSERALGARPTSEAGNPLVDALLWVKRPGESDGECNGGPPSGVWWPEYALALARKAGY